MDELGAFFKKGGEVTVLASEACRLIDNKKIFIFIKHGKYLRPLGRSEIERDYISLFQGMGGEYLDLAIDAAALAIDSAL
jgi:hypothetical protein